MKRICLILVVAIASATFISCTGTKEVEPIATPEPTIEAIDRRDYWKEHPEECPFEDIAKASALAKVATAVCPKDASEECLASVMACVWNRSRANGFPNSIVEVAEQPCQWEGMNSQSVGSVNALKLANKLLAEWESGEMCVLPIPRNCVFLTLGNNGIWFRSEWNGEDEVFIPYYGG